MANILVYIEMSGGEATADSLVALSTGRRIATKLGATLYALLPCADPPDYGKNDIIAVLSKGGADKIALITDEALGLPTLFATHGPAVTAACERLPPLLVIFPSSAGHELGPRIALTLKARYCSAAHLTDDGQRLAFEREIYRRKYRWREDLTPSRQPLVLSLAATTLPPPPLEEGDPEEAEVMIIAAPNVRGPSLEVETEASHTKAPKTILGGGVGLKDAETFALLQKLAEALDAETVASAEACAQQIAAPEFMAGLDGRCIDAEVYVAFGVTGSESHLAAIASHTQVIAINADAEEPIFRVARLGLVADPQQAIQALLEQANASEDA